MARAFDRLRREGVTGCVSFADDQPRTDSTGRQIFAGHVGTVYQALNATYIGRGTRRTMRLLPDGRDVCGRSLSKVRSGERRGHPTIELLEQHGARPLRAGQDPRAWLRLELPRLVRTRPHPGNHKYVWNLERQGRNLPAPLPYPKMDQIRFGPLFTTTTTRTP